MGTHSHGLTIGRRLSWIALAVAILAPAVARADPIQRDSCAAWKQADTCTHEAFRKFPDYTPKGNAEREAARLACLRNHRLPTPGSADAPDAANLAKSGSPM